MDSQLRLFSWRFSTDSCHVMPCAAVPQHACYCQLHCCTHLHCPQCKPDSYNAAATTCLHMLRPDTRQHRLVIGNVPAPRLQRHPKVVQSHLVGLVVPAKSAECSVGCGCLGRVRVSSAARKQAGQQALHAGSDHRFNCSLARCLSLAPSALPCASQGKQQLTSCWQSPWPSSPSPPRSGREPPQRPVPCQARSAGCTGACNRRHNCHLWVCQRDACRITAGSTRAALRSACAQHGATAAEQTQVHSNGSGGGSSSGAAATSVQYQPALHTCASVASVSE